jgi:arabinogalactan endo-1,4-beta-galactosidase
MVDVGQVWTEARNNVTELSRLVSTVMEGDGCDGGYLQAGVGARLASVPAGASRDVERLARRTTAARRGTRKVDDVDPELEQRVVMMQQGCMFATASC